MGGSQPPKDSAPSDPKKEQFDSYFDPFAEQNVQPEPAQSKPVN